MRLPMSVFLSLVLAAPAGFAAEAGIRINVSFGAARSCDAPETVKSLGEAYFSQSVDSFTEQLRLVLNTCHVPGLIKSRYLVVVFPAAVVPGAKASLVHVVYDAAHETVANPPVLLGVDSLFWLYLTDAASDRPVVQLSVAPAPNPILGSLGKLASTVVPKFKATAAARPVQTYAISLFLSSEVRLPVKRGTISESDDIGQDTGKAPLEGSATFTNQPRTWLTVNAGAGIFAGKTSGAARAKIDSKTYVSDPPGRAATFAGVTFHAPFDGSRPSPTPAEQWGFVVAAVLTPDVGIYAGPSYGWRGLSFTVGWATMWVNAPPKPKQIGDPVEDHEVLGIDRSGRLLIAATYAFGG